MGVKNTMVSRLLQVRVGVGWIRADLSPPQRRFPCIHVFFLVVCELK